MLYYVIAFSFFVYLLFERIKNTFSNKTIYQQYKTKKEGRLCSLMVVLYASIAFIAFSNIYLTSFRLSPPLLIFGLTIWMIGSWYRRTAIRSLGKNWSIYRTPDRIKRPMTLGTYAYSRHPYYSASILELIGYALICHSWIAFILVTFVYLPLIVLRALQEETFLLDKFSELYEEYRKQTPFLFNLKKFLFDSRLINHFKQISWLTRKYGGRQIGKILFMNRAVGHYFRGYMISQSVAALSKIGFLDRMIDEGSIDIGSYSKAMSINFKVLKIICDYLYVVRIFHKKVFVYSLTNYGHKLIKNARGVFDFIYAYAPIFENLALILTNEKVYGKDINRRGEFVGRASAELAELFPFPVARHLLDKYKLYNILDLGSGSGDFLIGFCGSENIQGFGIDLSPEAVDLANKKALEYGVANRAKFYVGDILKLNRFANPEKKVDVITAMFVLHEFLQISEDFLIDIFKSIKKAFPNKYILICELTRCSLDELYHFPSGVTEHHLFHSLSDQGLATVDEWTRIFKKAGLRIVDEERLDIAKQSIFLLESQSDPAVKK